jgi:hypothetical protein
MIVTFVKRFGTQFQRIKGRVPNLREPEKGLKDWVAPLFAFEFESITHSIGRIRVVSETSGPLRYRLLQPSWVH